ncbi:MAG: Ppx/GppA family phosphatase [Betaproteobacteria bacterium]|nr:Ppx/GppA family phosphatase [Betaproteobacteria bacterium]
MLAAIDMGSNSFRLQIGEYMDGTIRVIKTAREPNRLAAGLDKNKYLTDAATQAGLEALRNIRAVLDRYPISTVRAVATYTLRIAMNAPDFLVQAEEALGYPIEVISGEEEGRLIYLGVDNLLSRPEERRLVIDIGGGSTEMIRGKGKTIERVESFSIGTVVQSLTFFPGGIITTDGFEAAILSARSQFEDAKSHYRRRNWQAAYGSSGTMRAIAEIIAVNAIGDGRLTGKNLDLLRQKMIAAKKVSKLQLIGIRPERTASIIGGLSILIALMQDLKIPVMHPIESGLRMGIMWDLCLQSTEQDRREQSVHHFMQRYQADKKRASCVADCASILYEKMSPDSGVYKKQLYWGALMHEVGMFVSPTNYHKHGAYLVENADLAGFTAREQKQMGRLILAQKGNLRKLNGIFDNPDAVKAILAIRLAVMFMHSRVNMEMDEIHFRIRKGIEVTLPRKWLKQYQTLSYWLGRERNWWEEIGIPLLVREF